MTAFQENPQGFSWGTVDSLHVVSRQQGNSLSGCLCSPKSSTTRGGLTLSASVGEPPRDLLEPDLPSHSQECGLQQRDSTCEPALTHKVVLGVFLGCKLLNAAKSSPAPTKRAMLVWHSSARFSSLQIHPAYGLLKWVRRCLPTCRRSFRRVRVGGCFFGASVCLWASPPETSRFGSPSEQSPYVGLPTFKKVGLL